MDAYRRTAERLARELRPLDRARESMLSRARLLVRTAASQIQALHRGRWDARLGRRLDRERDALRRLERAHPRLSGHGALLQAYQEFAEAHLLRAHLERRDPPAPERLRIPPEAYLHALGDLVGELRRVTLGRLLANDVEGAQAAFDSMEKAYQALLVVDATGRLASLREKLDAARRSVERTRGDLVTAKRAKHLEKKIEGVSELLEEAEGRARPAPKRRDPDDLDLDAAWNKG